jgi:hypothetical protein
LSSPRRRGEVEDAQGNITQYEYNGFKGLATTTYEDAAAFRVSPALRHPGTAADSAPAAFKNPRRVYTMLPPMNFTHDQKNVVARATPRDRLYRNDPVRSNWSVTNGRGRIAALRSQ